MTPLENQTLGQRIVITFIIALIILFLLALLGWCTTNGWEDAASEEISISKFDPHLIELDKEAMDEAYKERVRHLFEIWMKDETGQPGRATVGVRQARRAYIEAMGKIEEREAK